MSPIKVLVSAGESSGDLYAAQLVEALKARYPEIEFFGCAGIRMQRAGVRPVVDARSLAVVGLAEVVAHIPRIWRELNRLWRSAEAERPQLAILTDSPDFHLRLAPKLKSLGIPIIYLIAPQVWAWRKGRLKTIKKHVDRLLCIFPFEESFFQRNGVCAAFIGHPLRRLVRPAMSRAEFFRKFRLHPDRPLVVLLPGSRQGEFRRHLPYVIEAAEQIYRRRAVSFVWAVPEGADVTSFRERISSPPIQIVEGETWDAIAHADVALAASGTVTVEAAILGTPMVTYYRVMPLSWLAGRFLVRVPFYTMVNLIAGRKIVPELIQQKLTGTHLAEEALALLDDSRLREKMRDDLKQMVATLDLSGADPMERAAAIVGEHLTMRSGVCPGA